MERVAFIIPTLNEAASIGQVLDRIPVDRLHEDGYGTTVYVIDGRSTDRTREIAAQKGASLILETRKGKGRALRTAFQSIDADYIIISDGDGTYPLEAVSDILRLLKTHDVVMGSRRKGTIEPGAMTKLNALGNNLLTVLANVLFRAGVSDMCTGLWGFRSTALNELELEAEGFDIEADMYIESVRKGLRLAELPIHYSARNDVAKLASLRDGFKIGVFVCKRWWAIRVSSAWRPSHGNGAEEPFGREATVTGPRAGTTSRAREYNTSDVYQLSDPKDQPVADRSTEPAVVHRAENDENGD